MIGKIGKIEIGLILCKSLLLVILRFNTCAGQQREWKLDAQVHLFVNKVKTPTPEALPFVLIFKHSQSVCPVRRLFACDQICLELSRGEVRGKWAGTENSNIAGVAFLHLFKTVSMQEYRISAKKIDLMTVAPRLKKQIVEYWRNQK